ncbi:MAG: hypothetical protein A3A81_07085 [Omnitrophica bacterium RIFCSPLOWO2_01_FULL_45_10b]|nr:MAG: hypothetical protein A3A81_07085 [Omnitrophica bacterium RIFCSPLOWO2_01_FULL_45_10b]
MRLAALEALKTRYEQLKHVLHAWEDHVKEYALLCSQFSNRSDELLKSALERVETAHRQFLKGRDEWKRLIQRPSFILSFSS